MTVLLKKYFFIFIIIFLVIFYILPTTISQAKAYKNTTLREEHATKTAKEKSQGEEGTKQNMQIFMHEHNGKEFGIGLGEEFVVELSENPTTGYIWTVSEYISPNISLINSKFFLPREDPHMVGQAGSRIFVFKAIKSGTALLGLGLRRPWGKEDKYADTFSIKLSIE